MLHVLHELASPITQPVPLRVYGEGRLTVRSAALETGPFEDGGQSPCLDLPSFPVGLVPALENQSLLVSQKGDITDSSCGQKLVQSGALGSQVFLGRLAFGFRPGLLLHHGLLLTGIGLANHSLGDRIDQEGKFLRRMALKSERDGGRSGRSFNLEGGSQPCGGCFPKAHTGEAGDRGFGRDGGQQSGIAGQRGQVLS